MNSDTDFLAELKSLEAVASEPGPEPEIKDREIAALLRLHPFLEHFEDGCEDDEDNDSLAEMWGAYQIVCDFIFAAKGVL